MDIAHRPSGHRTFRLRAADYSHHCGLPHNQQQAWLRLLDSNNPLRWIKISSFAQSLLIQ
jgi:hypothetical protein